MSVYGLQLAVRGMKPYFSPCSAFVNLFEILYGLSTVMVKMRQYVSFSFLRNTRNKRQTVGGGQEVGFCGVFLSGAELVCPAAFVYTAMDNTADKATSPACELPLCVQL